MLNASLERDLALNDAEIYSETVMRPSTNSGLFELEPAYAWLMKAKETPISKTLFGDFWNEGELCILFGDTGKGKSALAIQIAESIGSGEPIYPLPLTAKAQRVIYFDFELSAKQFEGRYSERPPAGDFHVNHYPFSPNLHRAEISRDPVIPDAFRNDYESFLISSIEKCLIDTEARVFIIDNLTYLRTATEQSKDALPLMKELKRIKSKFDASILALAHTPKRDAAQPITINHLQGSKMLSNFADNVFAVGESSKEPALRYLKQIKPRSSELRYGQDNVCVFQLEQPSNFLRFEFVGFGNEQDHLHRPTDTDRQGIIQHAKDLSREGKNQREIAATLGLSVGAINKYLHS